MRPVHQHGGQLRAASEKYGILLEQWLDLSTGISPHTYPLPAVPQTCWQRLPETNDGLEVAAANYYGSEYLLPVSGSQEAIQRLPLLRAVSQVGIISPAYHSHRQAWKQAGHQVIELASSAVEEALAELDVLLVVNPNNPTTERFSPQQLRYWHEQLTEHNGWLVVDEAYIDCTPEGSLIQAEPLEGMIVLRSVGKFFGLAGIRLGFVWAEEALLQRLIASQDDWSVSNLARWAGKQALADTHWQVRQREHLRVAGEKLRRYLQGCYPEAEIKSTDLFAYCVMDNAWDAFDHLARQGVLVRYFERPGALRFGLPGSKLEWERLFELQ